MSFMIGQFIGAMIITLVLSRIGLWAIRAKDGDIRKIFAVHLICILLATLIGGIGMSDGGGFSGGRAFLTYLVPQAIWLAVDLIRRHKRQNAPIER